MKSIILLFSAIVLISCGNDSTKQGTSGLQSNDESTTELSSKLKHKNISPYLNLLLN